MKFIVLVALFLVSCSKSDSEKLDLTFKGSNTSNLVVSELAKLHNRSAKKKIQILGGGSEEAIKEFKDGDLYYLNSSRKLSSHEIQEVENVHTKKVKEIIIGLDAIAIIVNPKLGVHELNLKQNAYHEVYP